MRKEFLPGSNINLQFLEKKIKRDYSMSYGCSVTVIAPSRIHMSLLDDSRVDLGKPGGGGVVLATDIITTKAVISIIEGCEDLVSSSFNAIKHLLAVLRKALDLDNISFKVEIQSSAPEHIGLGSNAIRLIAVAVGINELLGKPLSNKELRFIIGYNYVEDIAGEAHVSRGYETGCACVAALYGGLSLLADNLAIVDNVQVDPIYKVMVFIPTRKYLSGNDVSRSYDGEEKVFEYGEKFAPLLAGTAHKVYNDLIPMIKNEDLRGVGNVIYDLNFMMGTIGTIRGRYSVNYYGLFERIRREGGVITGISSTGPSVYVLAEKGKIDRIRKKISKHIERFIGIGNISNGIELRIDDRRVSYNFPNTNHC